MTGFTFRSRGRWVQQHPVAAFLALLFGAGYPLMALPILAHHGVLPGGSLPERVGLDTERFTVLVMMFGVMLPSALWVTWTVEGTRGLADLRRRATSWRFGLGWWVAIVLALPVTTIGLALLMGDTARPLTWSIAQGELGGLLLGFLLVNLWEELAWAGVVQTRIERTRNIAASAFLTAIPFVAIHMPFQFIGDFTLASIVANFVALLVFSTVFRLMIGFVLRGTLDSLLAVGLLHTIFNRSNNTDGIVAQLLEGEARLLVVLIATILFVVVAGLVVRRRAGRDYRYKLDVQSTPSMTSSLRAVVS